MTNQTDCLQSHNNIRHLMKLVRWMMDYASADGQMEERGGEGVAGGRPVPCLWHACTYVQRAALDAFSCPFELNDSGPDSQPNLRDDKDKT